MRLNKYLALCGLGSRRKCELLIQAGRVAVDGEIVTSLAATVDNEKNTIAVDEQVVSPPEKYTYILLNKPKGYVTTASDELGRKTVLDLVPENFRLFSVGRLDKDTTGALLITNDGQLSFQLMHPKFNVEKRYQVLLDKAITTKDVQKLQSGIKLEDGLTNLCDVKITRQDRKEIEMIIHEGRKRQIRRMLKFLGYEVQNLVRIRFATLTLAGLETGEWRNLTDQEVADLKKTLAGSDE